MENALISQFLSKRAETGMLAEFCSSVLGLVDSIPVFKSVFPKCDSYKQEELAHTLLQKEYNAHNAQDDVECLSELLKYSMSKDNSCVLSKSFSPLDVKHSMDSNKEKRKNLASLSVLVLNAVMKSATAENVASSGLNLIICIQFFFVMEKMGYIMCLP